VGLCISRLREDALAVRAATISVIVRSYFPDRRGKPNNPGAFFNHDYQLYTASRERIPKEVTRWLYTNYSWSEIEEKVQKEAHEQQAAAIPSRSEKVHAKTAYNQASQHAKYHQAAIDTNQAGGFADRLQAERLARLIETDCQEHNYSVKTRIQERRDSFIVIAQVDTRAICPYRTDGLFSSIENWKAYLIDTLIPAFKKALKPSGDVTHV